MSLHPNDIALRRLIARLAKLTSNDIDAILGTLDSRQRTIVQDLIDSYSMGKQSGNTAQDGQIFCTDNSSPALNGFSPWLIERLTAAKHGGLSQSKTFQMTDYALNALFGCATDLRPVTEPPLAIDTGKRQPLLGRILHAFMAWRPAS